MTIPAAPFLGFPLRWERWISKHGLNRHARMSLLHGEELGGIRSYPPRGQLTDSEAKREDAGMFLPPKRVLLSEQVLAALRAGLDDGRWQDLLPDEMALCRVLQVGRKTLRAAIDLLAQEGRIERGGRGRRHRILQQRGKAAIHKSIPGVIRYFSPVPFRTVGNVTMEIYAAMAERLSRRGRGIEFECHRGVFHRFSEREMERLATQPDTAGCVLLSAPRAMQEWFQRRGIPCVVTGCVYEGVTLPHVAFDYHASCRHAAHQFFSRGHRHIAFIVPAGASASIELSIAGFLAAGKDDPGSAHGADRRRLSVIVHENTAADICRKLDHELLGHDPPTGYLLAGGMDALTVLSHLWRRGWQVPQRASVIVRADEIVIERLVPPVTYYKLDARSLGRAAADMMLHWLDHGTPPGKPVLVMPEFVPGETLGPPPPDSVKKLRKS